MSSPYNTNRVSVMSITEFFERFPGRARAQRWQVFARDGWKCVECGVVGTHVVHWLDNKSNNPHWDLFAVREHTKRRQIFQDVLMTMDHIRPRSKGGSNKARNLQSMCSPCNSKKGNRWINHEQST